ncbi:MAG: TIGR03619 family F420-dependent LLM class oxidoreductase [Acidimicrobiales bacterium]
MMLGAKVPNSGALPAQRGIGAMGAELEAAGFDSLWVSDHIVMPQHVTSRYPFAADGKATWPSETPYYDAMISLAVIAEATENAVIGTAVLVLPLRNPVVLAKQAASIDVLSGGRLTLGLGAGWLAEEFRALCTPFESRGDRFVEWVELLRACWSGTPTPFRGQHYDLPEGVLCMPPPSHEIPLLIGGHSTVAQGRAGRIGDGWLAHQSASALDFSELEIGIEKTRQARATATVRSGEPWTTVRIIDSASRLSAVASAIPHLSEIGVNEIVVDTDWSVDGSAQLAHDILREACDQ